MGSERGIVTAKGTPPEVLARLREATARIAGDDAFRRQVEAQFTEMDYLDGPAWRSRLAEADGRFRDLWKLQPWSER
jgi:tripartite-type tricarboxylate transporter receptor subunit TctC